MIVVVTNITVTHWSFPICWSSDSLFQSLISSCNYFSKPEILQSRSQTNTTIRQRNIGNHETRHDSPRSCRDALSKKFQRIHKTRQNKTRSHKEELEISGIQDVRAKYKQNWINHLERMDNTRLPKYALNYKPRGRRDRGRPRKQWQRVDAGRVQAT